MRETLTLPGNDPSKSARSLAQENRLRSTSSWAAFRVCNCSGVKEFLTAWACFRSASSCCFKLFMSTWMRAALELASVVKRTTTRSAITDTKRTTQVNAHGKTRLLNGLLAKFRFVFTRSDSFGQSTSDGLAGFQTKHTRLGETFANQGSQCRLELAALDDYTP